VYRKSALKYFSSLSFRFVFAVTLLYSQEITGDIRGLVRDPSGAVVTGAKIEVTNTDRHSRALSDHRSRRRITWRPLLPVGRYKVTVEAAGFNKYEVSNIVINVSDRRVVDVTCGLAVLRKR